jgi:hypothetical protein
MTHIALRSVRRRKIRARQSPVPSYGVSGDGRAKSTISRAGRASCRSRPAYEAPSPCRLGSDAPLFAVGHGQRDIAPAVLSRPPPRTRPAAAASTGR